MALWQEHELTTHLVAQFAGYVKIRMEKERYLTTKFLRKHSVLDG